MISKSLWNGTFSSSSALRLSEAGHCPGFFVPVLVSLDCQIAALAYRLDGVGAVAVHGRSGITTATLSGEDLNNNFRQLFGMTSSSTGAPGTGR